MIAARDDPDQVRYDQANEADDANRRHGNRCGKCGNRKHQQPESGDREPDDRGLQIASRENIQMTRDEQSTDGDQPQ